MSSERPAKRIRQACEPCRRKKSRCPGERPICSHCARLRQNCLYADDRQYHDRSVTPTPQFRPPTAPSNGVRLEDRLKSVESQLAELLAHQETSRQISSPRDLGQRAVESPGPILQRPSAHPSPRFSETTLPSWEIIHGAAEQYLTYCDCQPLPLFHRSTFHRTLRDRDPEIIFAILAIALRFGDNQYLQESHSGAVNRYVEVARTIISKKVFDGAVELSTLQALCLLTLVEFTNGNTRRASMHCSLAMSLAHNAGLTSESRKVTSLEEKEERRRCFWSLFILKRLHGADFMVLDFSAEDNYPWYPETTGDPVTPSQHSNLTSSDDQGSTDKGIVAYAIQLSEVWFKITRYARRRGSPSSLPPWSSQSEYATILAHQMDFETRMPFTHRFEPAKFAQKSIEHLNANRDYWGPWLFVQFLYHTNLCLLNHPLLISLRLRNFKCVIPEIFLQHTSDLISSHATWIMNLINMLEAKQFKVSDPFLGHCVAIVATIYLQESFVDDPGTRQEKQECFERCLGFIAGFGPQWPHLCRIAEKLKRLAETVSSTYVASEEAIRQNRKLLIDLGQFFQVLEYSSSSEVAGSASQMFGQSLQAGLPSARTEMAQTSILPEPTRVERQEFGNLTPITNQPNGRHGSQQFGDASASEPTPLIYSDDELAVLAESFFHQRNEFDGNVNWWNTMGL